MNGITFFIQGLKEPDYVLLFMYTYGRENRMGEIQTRVVSGNTIQFKYPEVAHHHYKYRGSVDNNKSRRMNPLAIEEQFKTSRWPIRVFQFVIAVTEVNCNFLNHSFFRQELEEQLSFRFHLSQELINNPYINEDDNCAKRRRRESPGRVHKIVTLAPYRTMKNGKITKVKTKYTQLQCSCHLKKECEHIVSALQASFDVMNVFKLTFLITVSK